MRCSGRSKTTVERFGAIDVGIANAGIAFTGPLATTPFEQVERTLAVNLLGVWRTDRALIEQITQQRGYLLNIASLAAIARSPLMGGYTASKAGVEALSDVLRIETAPSGARVGCAYFGFLDTDLVRAGFAQPSSELMRTGQPGFIANPAPLVKAIDAIERGIERRSARLWAPRWVGPMLAARGLLQPLLERRALRDSEALDERAARRGELGRGAEPGPAARRRGAGDRVTTRRRRDAAGSRRVSSLAPLRRFFCAPSTTPARPRRCPPRARRRRGSGRGRGASRSAPRAPCRSARCCRCA